jgi:hypothetical protein
MSGPMTSPMTGPGWLADVLAALMLATAAYCAGRLVVARWWRRRTERDVDAAHVLTGVAMAGMLVPVLDPLAAPAWTAVFALTTSSFAVRAVLARDSGGGSGSDSARGSVGGGLRCPRGSRRHFPHLVLSGAMLYMYLALPAGDRMPGMSGTDDAVMGSARYPVVGLLLVLLLVGYAASVLDRALAPQADRPGRSSARGPAVGFLAPRAADCCDIVMSVSMVYLLVLML